MRGLFGGPAIGGLIGATGSTYMPEKPPQPAQGMFQGPRKVNWGGVIADALAGAAGMPGQYLASVQAQDQAAQRAKLAEAERAAGMQDWRTRFDYEQANKPAPNNDTVNDMAAAANWTPQQWEIYNKLHPPMMVQNWDGTRTVVGGGAAAGAPAAPVGKLTPIEGGPTPPASGTFRQPVSAGPVTFDQFFDAIIKQESGGRFGVANYEGSGARGIGQIMPETERALARRLGIPYQPNLMTGTGPPAQQYQLAIAREAVKEAWQAGGNGKDPVTAAMYYHGGSNRRIWGPRTRRYGGDILRRLGGK